MEEGGQICSSIEIAVSKQVGRQGRIEVDDK